LDFNCHVFHGPFASCLGATFDGICKQVGTHATIGIPQHFSNDWLLIAYLSRFGNVSLDSRAPHGFWLMGKGGALPEGFEKLETEMAAYELCKRL
jgi:hypothetical protein